jgi:2'-5' RNA ligase
MRSPSYRYFLGFRPDAFACELLATLAKQLGQPTRPDLLHLTLCVVADVGERDPFLAARIGAALAGRSLSSVPIRLGRVKAGALGPMATTLGKQEGIQQFYETLVGLLAARGVFPLHRDSGLHPHVTLGWTPRQFDPFRVAVEWLPQELLLIESRVGYTRHQVVGRWPLLPPPQGTLPLEMRVEPTGALRRTASSGRSAAFP